VIRFLMKICNKRFLQFKVITKFDLIGQIFIININKQFNFSYEIIKKKFLCLDCPSFLFLAILFIQIKCTWENLPQKPRITSFISQCCDAKAPFICKKYFCLDRTDLISFHASKLMFKHTHVILIFVAFTFSN
jgi:hypothetical protein